MDVRDVFTRVSREGRALTLLTEYEKETASPVSEEYQIPKREVVAEATLAGESPREIRLYLGESAERHAGPERPADLINGPGAFIPATDAEGRFLLMQREAISVLTVSWEDHLGGQDLEGLDSELATTLRVHLRLIDGRELNGTVTFVRPEGQRRLQDYLNGAELFFAVREEDSVHLVNRRQIAWITTD